MNGEKSSPRSTIESGRSPLGIFFLFLSSTEARCNCCQKKLKFSTKATSNLITHLRRCSPVMHEQYMHLKGRNHVKPKGLEESQFQLPFDLSAQASTSQRLASVNPMQNTMAKALLTTIACDQLPINIVNSQTFKNLLWTAAPKFMIPNRSVIENTLVPNVIRQMEETMRQKLSCAKQFYLNVDIWRNRSMAGFLGISANFIDAEWKLCKFVLAVHSFLEQHSAHNVAKSYNNVIEKFKLASRVSKIVSDNPSSIVEALQASLLGLNPYQTSLEIAGNDEQPDFISVQDILVDDTDINSLLAFLPERTGCFALAKQLCIKDCLIDEEISESALGMLLKKISDIVNTLNNSENAALYLRDKKISLKNKNAITWQSQLLILQSLLKDCKEINSALAMLKSHHKITGEDCVVLSELVSVLLPFKEAMQQFEGENIVTSSCICPVAIGLCKALEELCNSNLKYCSKLAAILQSSITARLMPFLNSADYRLASLLDPRFKDKWIVDNIRREEDMCMLLTHVSSRLGPEESSNKLTIKDVEESPAKKPKLFGFLSSGLKRESSANSLQEVESYLGEDNIHFDEDPLAYWKRKSEELPTLAALAKDYLGLSATTNPLKRLSSIVSNFCIAKSDLLGTDTFSGLLFIKSNMSIFDDVKI